jgi:hypothetical protein
MKQKKITVFLMLFFFSIQTNEGKKVSIISSFKKSKSNRFIVPVFAASELTAVVLYTLIPILLASLGNINFCLPAAPEIILENDNNILHLK